jgi:hypothetical protein
MTSSPLPFQSLREILEEHQLTDICIPEADRHAWLRVLERVIPSYPYECELFDNDDRATPQTLPDDAERVLSLAGSDRGPWPSLQFNVHGINMRMLFRSPSDCELDMESRLITADTYGLLVDLMRQLGDATSADVYLAPESRLEEAGMVYIPQERVFRAPRRGKDRAPSTRGQILGEIHAAMLEFHKHGPALSDRDTQELLDRLNTISHSRTELVLQDELTLDEHRDMLSAWSLAATLARPTPSTTYTEEIRSSCRQRLIDIARSISEQRSTP